MRFWFQRYSVGAFAILLCSTLCFAADLQSAKRAYEQKNYAVAFKEFSPLAEQGNADAQLYLGKMYMMGQGVLQDPNQAMKWLKASALQGNADAQFFVGSYFVLPHRDIAEGVKWLRLSADQGQQDAQLLLGKTYLQGDKDLPRDPVQAEMWMRLAAKNNLDFYQAELHTAESQMNAEQIARGKALADAWKPRVAASPVSKPSLAREKN